MTKYYRNMKAVSLDFINLWHKYIQYLHIAGKVFYEERDIVWLHSTISAEVGWQRPESCSSGHAFKREDCAQAESTQHTSTDMNSLEIWVHTLPLGQSTEEGSKVLLLDLLDSTTPTFLSGFKCRSTVREVQDSMECGKWKSPGQREVLKGEWKQIWKKARQALTTG